MTRLRRRQRYVGFIIHLYDANTEIKKEELIREIKNKCIILYNRTFKEMGIYLIRFDGSKGIIKCNHIEKDDTINLLKSIKKIGLFKLEIETLGTSGSIKSLIRKHLNGVIILN